MSGMKLTIFKTNLNNEKIQNKYLKFIFNNKALLVKRNLLLPDLFIC